MNRMTDDAPCIAEWRKLIAEFKVIIELPSGVNEALGKLKEKVKQSSLLTYRQSDALYARIENVLNGSYGRSKEGVKMNLV